MREKGGPSHTESRCGFCNGEVAQVLPKRPAGVCWIVHTHDSLLVIVLVIDQDGVIAFEVGLDAFRSEALDHSYTV